MKKFKILKIRFPLLFPEVTFLKNSDLQMHKTDNISLNQAKIARSSLFIDVFPLFSDPRVIKQQIPETENCEGFVCIFQTLKFRRYYVTKKHMTSFKDAPQRGFNVTDLYRISDLGRSVVVGGDGNRFWNVEGLDEGVEVRDGVDLLHPATKTVVPSGCVGSLQKDKDVTYKQMWFQIEKYLNVFRH